MKPSSAEALRADPRRVAEMFGRIAPRYDLMNRIMTGGLDQCWRRLAAAEAQVSPGSHLLDACCGTGDLTLALARRWPGTRTTGVDLSESMLNLARQKAARDGLCIAGDEPARIGARALRTSSADFLCADLRSLPFPDGEFAAATVAFGVRNVPDLEAAFGELARVVQPGGRVVCLEITTPPPGLGRRFHRLWFDRVVPSLGTLVAGDTAAYSYLPDSVRAFPAAEGLCEIMCRTGWRRVRFRRLGFGIIALHVAERATLASDQAVEPRGDRGRGLLDGHQG